MQSGGFYSWPAGYVGQDLPKTREEIGKDYLTYGIGHYYRIPFWELVFHDCIVSTWYWGDSSDFLVMYTHYSGNDSVIVATLSGNQATSRTTWSGRNGTGSRPG